MGGGPPRRAKGPPRANICRDVADTGIRFVTVHDGVIAANTVRRAGAHGISLEGGSEGNEILDNVFDRSGAEDCRADPSGGTSTAGTLNDWPGNVADDDTPPGICVPV